MFDSLARSLPRLTDKLTTNQPPRGAPPVDRGDPSPSEGAGHIEVESTVGPPTRPHARTVRGRPSEATSLGYASWTRRREPRFHAIADRVWLQWWSDGEFNGLSARLVNVSRHGALVLAGVRLPEQQSVRLMLEEATSEVAVESVVRGLVAGSGGLYQVRLEFQTDCPDDFFQAAANGFEAWLGGSRSWV